MTDLGAYISKKMVIAFSRKISSLRKKTASIPFAKRKASYGVGGNTFRAFTGWKRKPSVVYREWAEVTTISLNEKSLLQKSKSRDRFLVWHEQLAASLQAHWKRRQGMHLSVAHCMKCVDGYVAWLVSLKFDNGAGSVALEQVANCLLDQQILKKLNACYSNALPMGPKPSMGHITHIETYVFCQELIGAFVDVAGGTRILFDRFGYKRGNG